METDKLGSGEEGGWFSSVSDLLFWAASEFAVSLFMFCYLMFVYHGSVFQVCWTRSFKGVVWGDGGLGGGSWR